MAAQAEAPNPSEERMNWPFKFFRFKLDRDNPDEARNVLLVVATLIAAVTFQAAVNPPGGVWQDDSNSCGRAGKSIWASRSSFGFTMFLVGNTLAFSTSSTLISLLVQGCPFSLEVQIALLSMTLTYGSSIASVMPSGSIHLSPAPLVALILPYLLRTVSELLKERSTAR